MSGGVCLFPPSSEETQSEPFFIFLCYYAEYAHMLGAERCSTPATGTWCEKTDWNDPVKSVVMANGCNSGDFP